MLTPHCILLSSIPPTESASQPTQLAFQRCSLLALLFPELPILIEPVATRVSILFALQVSDHIDSVRLTFAPQPVRTPACTPVLLRPGKLVPVPINPILRPLSRWVQRVDFEQREPVHNTHELQSASFLCCHKLLVSLQPLCWNVAGLKMKASTVQRRCQRCHAQRCARLLLGEQGSRVQLQVEPRTCSVQARAFGCQALCSRVSILALRC
mmetsp:Transcript_16788/g.43119  ORF Transcript_16788/g.43119 Transcript_16788/m.43119 type:complete len:211 (+) Transcript_16788:384-1016(+)